MINTDKRIIAIFTAFCIAIGSITLRLYYICMNGTELVGSLNHSYKISIAQVRGEIFDCNGERLTDVEYENTAVLKPTAKAAGALENVLDSDSLTELKERMKKGNALSVNIGRLEFNQNSDALMLKKYSRYSENQPARHIIGYINSDGRGVTGIEKSFDEILYTGELLQVRFKSDAYGRIISGAPAELMNTTLEKGSVTLTIDTRIQRIVENSLKIFDVEQGGTVVVDIRTGAIRAMASRPDFDSLNISAVLNDRTAPLVNRGLGAYAVGSVFKAAVAAAALENGIDDFYYKCTGVCEVDGVQFGCNKHTAHGELNMQKALECSCNTYFINLAQKIGAQKLFEITERLGFGQEIPLAEGLTVSQGTVPKLKELQSSGNLANFSFGQGSFTASMLQLSELFAAIGNGGKYTTPYLVEKTQTADGTQTVHKAKYPVVALSEKTSERLTKLLVSVVENGNASKARMKNGITAAGKTATAQTGTFFENGEEICNTWFCGFFPAEQPRYVIVILKQGGSSGAQDCAPIFKSIADKISDLG